MGEIFETWDFLKSKFAVEETVGTPRKLRSKVTESDLRKKYLHQNNFIVNNLL